MTSKDVISHVYLCTPACIMTSWGVVTYYLGLVHALECQDDSDLTSFKNSFRLRARFHAETGESK
jgi:hypothetical protein